jgi:hypothetical protein
MNAVELQSSVVSYLLSRETTPVYARQIRNRNAEFGAYIGDAEVTSDLLNRFIIALGESRKPITVRGYRTSVLSVLRFGGWHPETQVRSVRVAAESLDCFTSEEIVAQLKTAATMKGVLPNGVSNADFWALAIHAGYGIAVRQADLLSINAADIADDGACMVVPSKTKRAVSVKFPPEALRIIRAHKQGRAVPWPHSQEHFRQEFRALCIAAGVRRGSWKWLRRSAGTYAELRQAGSGHRLLGNSPRIFQRHYDASATIDPRPIEPPRLRLRNPWWRRWLGWTG